jgi:nucleotide-binding universal stress UspA family protein
LQNAVAKDAESLYASRYNSNQKGRVMMYKHILIAVDGSDTSNKALAEAINLAKDQQAELKIVYTVDEASIFTAADIPDPVRIEQTWVEAGKKILEEAKQKAQAAGVQVETKILETDMSNTIADSIVGEAKSWPADIIVAGTHGRRGISHLMMGSVAEGITRITPVPLLLIHR